MADILGIELELITKGLDKAVNELAKLGKIGDQVETSMKSLENATDNMVKASERLITQSKEKAKQDKEAIRLAKAKADASREEARAEREREAAWKKVEAERKRIAREENQAYKQRETQAKKAAAEEAKIQRDLNRAKEAEMKKVVAEQTRIAKEAEKQRIASQKRIEKNAIASEKSVAKVQQTLSKFGETTLRNVAKMREKIDRENAKEREALRKNELAAVKAEAKEKQRLANLQMKQQIQIAKLEGDIRTERTLTLRQMSPALRAAQREIYRLQDANNALTVSTRNVNKAQREGIAATYAYGNSLFSVHRQGGVFARSVNNSSQGLLAFQSAALFAGRALGNFSTYTGAAIVALAANKILETADAYTALANQLQLVSSGAQDLAVNMETVKRVSLDTYSDVSVNAKLLTATSETMAGLGKGYDDTIRFMGLYNKALMLTNPTSKEATAATIQFVQAMGSGVLRGEEFNSIMENGRGVAMMLADGIGVPIGALKTMAHNGELTSEVVINALTKMGAEIDELHEKKIPSMSMAWQNFYTNTLYAIGGLDENVGELMSSMTGLVDANGKAYTATQQLAQAIMDLSGNLEPLLNTIALLAGGAALLRLSKVLTRTGKAMHDLHKGAGILNTALMVLSKNPIMLLVKTAATAGVGLYTYFQFERTAREAEAFTQALEGINGKLAESNQLIGRGAELTEVQKSTVATYEDKVRAVTDEIAEKNKELAEINRITNWSAVNGKKAEIAELEKKLELLSDEIEMEAALSEAIKQQSQAETEAAKKASDARRQLQDDTVAYNELLGEYQDISFSAYESEKESLELIDRLLKANIISLQQYRDLKFEIESEAFGFDEEEATKKTSSAAKISYSTDREDYRALEKEINDEASQRLELRKQQLAVEQEIEDAQFSQYLVGKDQTEVQLAQYEYDLLKRVEAGELSKADAQKLYAIRNQNLELQYQHDELVRISEQARLAAENAQFGEDEANFDLLDKLDALAEVENPIERLAESWKDFGNEGVEAIAKVMGMQKAFTKQQASDQAELETLRNKEWDLQQELQQGKEVDAETLEKLAIAQAALEEKIANDKIAFYGEVAGAMANVFAEGTAAAKGFQIIQRTMALYDGIRAVIRAWSDPFPLNLVTVPMTVSAVGSLLSQMGAGSLGSTSVPSTVGNSAGVLGDSGAASESILNLSDSFEEIQVDQYEELRAINKGVQSLAGGINDAVTNLYTSNLITTLTSGLGSSFSLTGNATLDSLADMLGTGTTTKYSDPRLQFTGTLADLAALGEQTKSSSTSFVGITVSSSTKTVTTALEEAFLGAIDDIGDSMVELSYNIGEQLNLTSDQIAAVLNDPDNFVLNEVSLKGTATEIEAALQEAFSNQADVIAKELAPELVDLYRNLGETAFDTLGRVITTDVVGKDLISMTTGVDLDNMVNASGVIEDVSIEVTQSLTDLAGGLDNLQESVDDYFGAFFSEEEQFERLTYELTNILDAYNLGLASSRENYRALVEAQDLTTEAGQEAYIALINAADMADEYYSVIESGSEEMLATVQSSWDDFISQSETIKEGLLGLVGSEELLAYQREKELEQIDPLLRSHQEMLWALQDEKVAVDGFTNGLLSSVSQLGSAFDSIEAFVLSLSGVSLTTENTFFEQYAAAMSGDYDALASIATTAQSYVDSLRSTASTSVEARRAETSVAAMLLELPEQLTPEQFIADEIKTALGEQTVDLSASIAAIMSNNFDALSEVVGEALTLDEFKGVFAGTATDAQLETLFATYDLDGNGIITKLESVTVAAMPTDSILANALLPVLDKTADNVLTVEQAKDALVGLASDETIGSVIQTLDTNNDGLITAVELSAMSETSFADAIANSLSPLFNSIDLNPDGVLTFDELKTALGEYANDEQLAELINRVDVDNNGVISALEATQANTLNTVDGVDPLEQAALDQIAALGNLTTEMQDLVSPMVEMKEAMLSLRDIIAQANAQEAIKVLEAQLADAQSAYATSLANVQEAFSSAELDRFDPYLDWADGSLSGGSVQIQLNTDETGSDWDVSYDAFLNNPEFALSGIGELIDNYSGVYSWAYNSVPRAMVPEIKQWIDDQITDFRADLGNVEYLSGIAVADYNTIGDLESQLAELYKVAGIDGSHATGLSYVPFDGYRAELHKGERVMTAADNMGFRQMAAEINYLRSDIVQLNRDNNNLQTQVVKYMRDQSEVIDNWNNNGMPEVRDL